MNDPRPLVIDAKTSNDRLIMHVLYAMHTAAWVTLGALPFIALVFNYVRRSDEHDAFYLAHHNYMIASFWWTVFWLIIVSPLYLFLILPGVVAQSIVGLWYLYRCLKGWLRFSHDRLP